MLSAISGLWGGLPKGSRAVSSTRLFPSTGSGSLRLGRAQVRPIFCENESGDATLGLAVGVQEHVVVCNGLLDELDEQEHLGRIHHRVDALLVSLHRIEGGHVEPKQDDGRMASHAHGHALQSDEALVLLWRRRGEEFFEDYHLIGDLAEFVKELTVVDGGMDLVAQLVERGLGCLLKFWRAQAEQGGLVVC